MHFTLLFSKADKPMHRAIKRGKRNNKAGDSYFKSGIKKNLNPNKKTHLLLSKFLTKLAAFLYQSLFLKLVELAVR